MPVERSFRPRHHRRGAETGTRKFRPQDREAVIPINSRSKGKRGELQIVTLLKEHGWPNARRTSDGRAQSSRGDITGGPEGVHIEVKSVARLNICAALDQAIDDANPLDIPVIVHRPSRHEWMATLPAEELFALLAARETR